jgi:hypothetical protein
MKPREHDLAPKEDRLEIVPMLLNHALAGFCGAVGFVEFQVVLHKRNVASRRIFRSDLSFEVSNDSHTASFPRSVENLPQFHGVWKANETLTGSLSRCGHPALPLKQRAQFNS